MGAFLLMGGIIVVALHPYWRGMTAVIVSLLGWLMVVRGVLLLAFPDVFMSMANQMIGAEMVWPMVFAGFTVVGLYLTYVGWLTGRRGSVSHAPGSIPELPRAADTVNPQRGRPGRYSRLPSAGVQDPTEPAPRRAHCRHRRRRVRLD